MSPLCQVIGVFLYCTTAGPPTAQLLQPRMPQPDTYIVGTSAASTTRQSDLIDEMIAAHLRAERARK